MQSYGVVNMSTWTENIRDLEKKPSDLGFDRRANRAGGGHCSRWGWSLPERDDGGEVLPGRISPDPAGGEPERRRGGAHGAGRRAGRRAATAPAGRWRRHRGGDGLRRAERSGSASKGGGARWAWRARCGLARAGGDVGTWPPRGKAWLAGGVGSQRPVGVGRVRRSRIWDFFRVWKGRSGISRGGGIYRHRRS